MIYHKYFGFTLVTIKSIRKIKHTMKRKLFKIIYERFGRHLPLSNYHINIGQKAIRYFLVKNFAEKVGIDVNIEKGASFPKSISIGDRSGIGVRCEIYGKVTIGDDVLMGPDVVIYTINHKFRSADKKISEQGYEEMKEVVIGNDVWIGRKAIILPGVTIHDGAVIGAGAVVAKDIPPYAIAVGNPVQIKGYRK